MIVYERPVRFEEVDAAGIAFFARFFNWCHEAMERFFDGVEGGYVGLIVARRVGFPAVHVKSDWKSPLRYGDTTRIETSVAHVGTSSATFRYVFWNGEKHVATIEHVVVSTSLDDMKKIPMPHDCRVLLVQHLS